MNTKSLKLHQRTCVQKAIAHEYGPAQFCYPTGTGKTLAEAHIIAEHIKAGERGIFVVLAPRIMLAQQLFSEIWAEVVVAAKIDCSFFSLHSGKSPDQKSMSRKLRGTEFTEQDDKEEAREVYAGLKELGLSDRQIRENFGQGTKVKQLREAAEAAEEQGRPLIIVSTYHSAERLTQAFEGDDHYEGREISIMIADEGHNAVALGFTHVHDIPATKRFYFTATLKFTDGGENGLGMQNEEKFGLLLDSLSPKDAVYRGLIVGPRIHYVEIDGVSDENELDADYKAIEAAFIAHSKAVGGIGAKLLVAARGTLNIENIIKHSQYFARLRHTRPNLKVFDISSMYGARINGAKVERHEFLQRLQAMKEHEEAIIIHYDILSEGIDVPGITGVMPLRNLGTSKFLQTLGRATRLHPSDRERLQNEATAIEEAAKIDWFVKPFAWLVLPCYGKFGNEITAAAEVYVRNLRTFGWIPGEGDLLTEAGGESEPKPIEDVHKEGKKLPKQIEMMSDIHQRFEDREAATKAYEVIKMKTAVELLDLLEEQ